MAIRSATATQTISRRSRKRRLRVEALQSRRLFAADLAVATATATPTNVAREVRPDVNGNGFVSAVDVLQVINILADSARFEGNPYADANQDGEVTVDDIDAVFGAMGTETEPRLGVLNYTPERFASQATSVAPMQSSFSNLSSSSNYGTSSSTSSSTSTSTSTSTPTSTSTLTSTSTSTSTSTPTSTSTSTPTGTSTSTITSTSTSDPQTGSISDWAWLDANGDGIQSSGEEGVQDVLVSLYGWNSGGWEFLNDQLTDAGGNYEFDGLYAGDYAVSFSAPPGFDFTVQHVGSNDTTDSDAVRYELYLDEGEHRSDVDAGLIGVPAACSSGSAQMFVSMTTTDSCSELPPGSLMVEENYWAGADTDWSGTEDILWLHNRHRWSLTLPNGVAPTDIDVFEVYAVLSENTGPIPAEGPVDQLRNHVLALSPLLVGAIQGNNEIIADPIAGEKYYIAIYSYDWNGQTIGRSTRNTVHKAGISASVEFNAANSSADPNSVNPNYTDGDPQDTIFPEQNIRSEEPGAERAFTTIGTKVSYSPAIPDNFSGSLALRVFDPDSAAVALRDINDDSGKEAEDNYRGVPGESAPRKGTPGAGLRDTAPDDDGKSSTGFARNLVIDVEANTSSTQAFFRVLNSQPGNNWIVGVHDEASVLASLEFRNGTELVRQRGARTVTVPEENQTDELVAKRHLWIEIDAMPGPNAQACANMNLSEDPCSIGSIDSNDLIGFLSAHLDGTGIVPVAATYNVRPTLPQFIQYGGGDERPTGNPPVSQTARSVRDARSLEHFWTVQVVSAYESTPNMDADAPEVDFAAWFANPAAAPALVGYSYGRDGQGPSVVYTEEVRDLRENNPADLQAEPRLTTIVAAHEIMHRFYGWHDTGGQLANQNLMDGRKSMASAQFLAARGLGPHTLDPTPGQFQVLQSRDRPL